MPFCAECGNKLKDHERFCGECGAPAPAAAAAPATPGPDPAAAEAPDLDKRVEELSLANVISGSMQRSPAEVKICAFKSHEIPAGKKSYVDAKGQTFCEDHMAMMTKLCSVCGEKTLLHCVTVGDTHFHPQCWTCGEDGCSTVLSTESDRVDPEDGKYYCHTHLSNRQQVRLEAEAQAAAVRAAKRAAGGESSAKAAEGLAAMKAKLEAARLKKLQKPEVPQLKQTYAYDELQQLLAGSVLPEGFNKASKELYLSDEEFKEKFGTDKEAFAKLPKWKRDKQKTELKLF